MTSYPETLTVKKLIKLNFVIIKIYYISSSNDPNITHTKKNHIWGYSRTLTKIQGEFHPCYPLATYEIWANGKTKLIKGNLSRKTCWLYTRESKLVKENMSRKTCEGKPVDCTHEKVNLSRKTCQGNLHVKENLLTVDTRK
jgi:hypothetical protein